MLGRRQDDSDNFNDITIARERNLRIQVTFSTTNCSVSHYLWRLIIVCIELLHLESARLKILVVNATENTRQLCKFPVWRCSFWDHILQMHSLDRQDLHLGLSKGPLLPHQRLPLQTGAAKERRRKKDQKLLQPKQRSS